MIQPFESYGFARIDDWLASHVAFAVSLDRNQWRRRLIESYRDRLFRMRGRIAFCRGEGEPIDTPQMRVWIGQADSMAQEIQKYQAEGKITTSHVQGFSVGGKPGTPELLREAIAGVLQRHRGYTNLDVWIAVSSAPPEGWTPGHDRKGRHFSGPSGAHMSYTRFRNIAGEERKKLKSPTDSGWDIKP